MVTKNEEILNAGADVRVNNKRSVNQMEKVDACIQTGAPSYIEFLKFMAFKAP